MEQELIDITITPITVPATPEKVYDQMWVTDFVVRAENPLISSLYAILRPYSQSTGEVLVQGGTEQVVNLQDLFGILEGRVIEPKLTPETIAMGGQLMGLALMFFKAVLADKAKPDEVIEEPIIEEPIIEEPIIEPEII